MTNNCNNNNSSFPNLNNSANISLPSIDEGLLRKIDNYKSNECVSLPPLKIPVDSMLSSSTPVPNLRLYKKSSLLDLPLSLTATPYPVAAQKPLSMHIPVDSKPAPYSRPIDKLVSVVDEIVGSGNYYRQTHLGNNIKTNTPTTTTTTASLVQHQNTVARNSGIIQPGGLPRLPTANPQLLVQKNDESSFRMEKQSSESKCVNNKSRKRVKTNPEQRCHSCNCTETPEWRRGPDGARTLCNACGLHYAKLLKKRKQASIDLTSKQPAAGRNSVMRLLSLVATSSYQNLPK